MTGRDTRPGKMAHPCCPNARHHMIGYRTECGYNWRLYTCEPGTSDEWLSVIYCPWCAVNLNEWAKLQRAPRLVAVGERDE